MEGLIVLAFLFLLFWLALIRPQRARAREQQELLKSLEPGDEIVTAGGLYGVIKELDDEVLHVEIADGLVVRTARNAVAGIVEEVDAEDAAEDAEEAQLQEGGEAGEQTDSGYARGSS